jgi:hypothetical protein
MHLVCSSCKEGEFAQLLDGCHDSSVVVLLVSLSLLVKSDGEAQEERTREKKNRTKSDNPVRLVVYT